ncbi:sigma-54 interaction domain-containing protein [Neobacillus mesonae]|uniref:HTH-type transcriptional regulatory protein TyrR n=1 Tax=Neobacillus mesonae TaxID=1193713 RepID=A0A3T0HZR8_9BACI|nr:sigma 54-interacting transcriptional regulator [Neobacillus mesonae]AZU62553.1 RNA polymerase subunit sigma-54 [Neobacillus mesonae]
MSFQSAKEINLEISELEDIFEGSFDEIMVVNKNGIVKKVNSVCEINYHLPIEEIIGKHVEELEQNGVFSPSASLQVIEKKVPIELLQKTRYGRYLHVRARPLFNNKGNLTKVVCYSRDLTELINLRKKLEEIEEQLETYHNELNEPVEFHGVISKSSEMQKVLKIVKKIAKVDTTVLILGETGVGKSKIVQHIHKLSGRGNQVLNEINCAALPEQLIESELFGYEGGSFTGAFKSGKEGLIAASRKGTLFLDEIGELPLHLQGKLLQVLQEKKVRPVGGKSYIEVDVRIIAATNRDLEEMVEQGKFRKDLYYRLNIIPIYIPPLKERRDDILPLAYHFLDRFNNEYQSEVRFSPKVLEAFLNYSWNGNIRELENLIERLVIISDDVITIKDLPYNLREYQNKRNNKMLNEIIEDLEKAVITESYKQYNSTYKVAKELGISQSSVQRKIKKYLG